ncbi:Cystathionine gamma-lyase [Acidisarcina polymorpha]|uniref:Cystathionine gamma-lyase n=1 Tax=Acidisarcina polymorpha TaxID=2211140 RepID=A0A2Z5FSP5_9BACT|nr:PLP-dependent aspartate aminotransferase family protein [Acidisarcina polymorpha]AXC09494.1 Cystathionine gamma-lyase [Acidisarcina polymorpha]
MAGEKAGFATRAIHTGQPPDPTTGAVNVPLYLSSTYAQEEIGKDKGYDYSRAGNPTRTALEVCLASLEGGLTSHVFGSGMAAIAALVTLMKSGDHVICGENVYGGTPRLFNQVFAPYGIDFTYVDTSNVEALRAAIRPETRLVHIETPTNPLMNLTDIAAVAEVCHSREVELSVDNTFMSPYFQRPIDLGADIVMHSTTKFLNGHSDGLGGVLVGTTPEHTSRFDFVEKAVGGILSPFESWLILRGVKTLAVRMRQHDENGRIVAQFLDGHGKVDRVFYPGLSAGRNAHPQYELAAQQMTGFGSMITIELGSFEKARSFTKQLRVATLGESLGGVETLVSHPATMTHAGLGAEGRAKVGITDGMVRLSVGIEDVGDLLEDFEQALAMV